MKRIIDCWSPRCSPCLALAPILEELNNKYKGQIKFLKINIDKNTDFAQVWNIRGIPTLLLLEDDKEIGRIVGLMSFEKIDEIIKEWFEKYED